MEKCLNVCEKRKAKSQDPGQCDTTILVLGDQVVRQIDEHTHEPIPGYLSYGEKFPGGGGWQWSGGIV